MKYFEFDKKIGFAHIIALIALAFSVYTSLETSSLKKDNASVKDGLRPKIKLDARLNPSEKLVPNLQLENIGQLEAIQFRVEIRILVYSKASKTVNAFMGGSDGRWVIGSLPPFEKKVLKISEATYGAYMGLPNLKIYKNTRDHIVEVQLKYKRGFDLKEFVERAFFFYVPDIGWVSENNDLVKNNDKYKHLVDAAINSLNPVMYEHDYHSALLHPSRPELIEEK